MLTTSLMDFVSIAVLKRRADRVCARIVELGIFDPTDIREVEEGLGALASEGAPGQVRECESLAARLEKLRRSASIPDAEPGPEVPYGECSYLIGQLEKRLGPLVSARDGAVAALRKQEEILRRFAESLPFPVHGHEQYRYLRLTLGEIDFGSYAAVSKALAPFVHYVYPWKTGGRRVTVLLMTLARDRDGVDGALAASGWKPVAIPEAPAGSSDRAAERMKRLQRDLDEAGARLAREAEQVAGEAAAIMAAIAAKRAQLAAGERATATGSVVIFSGWVPRARRDDLAEELRRLDPSAAVETRRPGELKVEREDVPVLLENGRFLKPFEALAEPYGIPVYGSINPTVFVALSFLVMFGVMFGDAGHGLALVLLGLALRRFAPRARAFGVLLAAGGVSAALFGLLEGSFFGYEFPSVWIKPMDEIGKLFAFSIFLGAGLISLGVALHVGNLIRRREYGKALFDRTGLVAGVAYWAGIALVMNLLARRAGPAWAGGVLMSGLAAIFLFPVVRAMRSGGHENPGEAAIESGIDLLEIVTGFLKNTVSFIRIGAFAMAHAGLFFAVFAVAGMLRGALSWGVLVLGNVFIIGLEGLIVAIQSARLNYYEFFSKFFETGRRRYRPLGVR